MKIRTGFVSNSSSSSFIIALDPFKTVNDIKDQLFGDDFGEHFSHPYNRKGASTEEIAETVYADTIYEEIDQSEITDEILSGSFDVEPDFPFRVLEIKNPDIRKRELDKYNDERRKLAGMLAKEFLARGDVKGKRLYIVEYSDNDGDFGCLMEHGGVFNNIPHIRVSKH